VQEAGWLITGAATLVALLLARSALPNAIPAGAETVAPAHDEFACKQLVEIVTDYLDGVLPPALREDFQTHIAACDGCDEYVRQIGATIRALQAPDLQPTPLTGRSPLRTDVESTP
jgi:anti-sigma factor RsiW